MKALEIRNGDLVVGAGGFTTIEGAAKVRQDLGIAVREPYGSDRFHPRWGTLLHEYVGTAVGSLSEMRIQAEIARIVQNYIRVQGEALERDVATNRRPRFSKDEVVERVESIAIRQEYDKFRVRVIVRTFSNTDIAIIRSVS